MAMMWPSSPDQHTRRVATTLRVLLERAGQIMGQGIQTFRRALQATRLPFYHRCFRCRRFAIMVLAGAAGSGNRGADDWSGASTGG